MNSVNMISLTVSLLTVMHITKYYIHRNNNEVASLSKPQINK
jgi:hypothetical protein